MADRADITPELLRQLLHYEPETGRLFWRRRNVQFFQCKRSCAVWNARYADKEAFTYGNSHVYRTGRIFDRMFMAHRVAFAIYHGVWPEGQIDHVNHNRIDNRIENLRVVSNLKNSRNASRSKGNTSGVTGVVWDESRGKWQARIMVDGKHIFLGRYKNFNDAIIARQSASAEYGFHANHGQKNLAA